MDDDVIRGATVVHEGTADMAAARAEGADGDAVGGGRRGRQTAGSTRRPKAGPIKASSAITLLALGAIALAAIGADAPPIFMQHLTVFVLACFLGFHVIWNVTPALHTPLMSVTNAISGIIVIGALLQIGNGSWFVKALAAVSVLIATINICGGFWVTHRMLKMFHRD